MLTYIFLAFVGIFAIAGTFLSIEQKRRSDEGRERLTFPEKERQAVRGSAQKTELAGD